MTANSIFFDIGSCHGSWTLPALANGARVYAFEPDPRYNESLLDSVAINPGFQERLWLGKVGVYSQICMGNFLEMENVPFTTIDDFVRNYKVAPDFIKVDVEGVGVLEDAVKTLEQKPKLFIENHFEDERHLSD
ncbi:MAG: FkbM family methyltransferase [Candidatus Nitrosopolaris sp.]